MNVPHFIKNARLSTLLIAILFFSSLSVISGEEDDVGILNVMDRDCVKAGNCQCYSLWDSDCDCVNKDAPMLCGLYCRTLCRQGWDPKNTSDYNLTECISPEYKRYYVKLFTASRDPLIGKNMYVTKGLLEVMNKYVNFEVLFLAQEKTLDNGTKIFASHHGEIAIRENFYQLCSMYIYKKPEYYMPFLLCININTDICTNDPKNKGSDKCNTVSSQIVDCSRMHGLDYNKILACAETIGPELLSMNIQTAKAYGIESTSFLTVDDRVYELKATTRINDTIAMMCHVFLYSTAPFPWWVFGFLGSLIVSMFLVIITIKSFSVPKFVSWITQSEEIQSNP